jgi:AcrR family transcriptional regulator
MATRGRPTTSRDARRAAVRIELLNALTRLLVERGSYATVGVNELVADAGIAKSTFYQHFTGKNDLLRSLLEEVIIGAGAANAWLDFDGPVTVEQVKAHIQERTETYLPYLPVTAAAFDAIYVDSEVRETARQLMTLLNDSIEAHVRKGQAGGWIDPSLPPHEIAVWLNWAISRGFQQLVLGADDATIRERIAGFSQLVWRVLYAPTQSH